MRRYHIHSAALMLLLFVLCSATHVSAQSRKGYALWCSKTNTLYFVQADTPPNTYNGIPVTKEWEINDTNLRNGVAAPAWIQSFTSSETSKVPENLTTVVIENNFRFVTPAGFYSWFHGCSKLTTVRGLANLNTSRAGYMNKMFYGCTSLETLDFTGVDMQPVINTTMMFYGCSALKTIYADEAWTQPHSAYMFTDCEQLKGYNPAKVDGSMANGENGYFNSDSHIYALCLHGQGSDDGYLYFVRTPETISKDQYYDGRLVDDVCAFADFENPSHGGWDWSGNTLLRHVVIEPSFRNVRLTTLEGFFKGKGTQYGRGFTDIDGLEYLNTSEVTSMRSMFEDNAYLPFIDVSSLDMSHVQDMGRMFKGCSNITSLNLSGVNTSNATNMEYLFAGCEKLKSLDLSPLDTRKVTNMSHLFEGCWSLKTIDVSPLNTSAVTNMEGMFKDCYIDASATGKIGLEELDVNGFDMTKVTNVKEMFRGCGLLKTIFCDNTWEIDESDDMFLDCINLSAHISYDPDKVDGTYANPHTGYFFSELDLPTYDPQGRFIVSNTASWEEFARLVNEGNPSLGAVMMKDVDLGNSQVKVGTDSYPYTGTFDGNGHTLNIAYVSDANYCAPFSYAGGCTISNLHVTGSIQASQRGAAGLVGSTSNSSSDLNISKCWSSVEINSTIEGFGSLGGFIGFHSGEVKVKITNCLFDGKILGENTYGGGGFIGRVYSDDSKRAVTFASSLMNAADIGFLTDIYQNSYASGPFYGFYKSPISDKYDYSCVAYTENKVSGFTRSFGSIVNQSGRTSQGYDWTQESVAQIVSWLNYDPDDKCWQVVDGKPVLKF